MITNAVKTEFRATDHVSSVFKAMAANAGNSIDAIGNRLKTLGKSTGIDKGSRGLGRAAASFAGNLAANAVSRGFAMAETAIVDTTRQFITFEDVLTSAALKFPDVIKPGTAAFADLEKQVREMASTSRFSMEDAARGMNELAAIGFTSAQSLAAFPKVMQLATAASVDLSGATEIATNTLGMFGLMTPDSAQLAVNLERVNDVLASVANLSSTDVPGIFETLKESGAFAKLAGLDMEMLGSAITVMANAGLKGSKGGTQLKNMLLNMADVTPKAQKAMKKLGVSFTDLNTGNFRELPDIVDDLVRATKGMGSVERTKLITQIFGGLSTAGVDALMSAGGDALRGFNKQLDASKGYAEDLSKTMGETLQSKTLKLQAAFTDLGFRILGAFSGKAGENIDAIAEAVRNFDVKPIVSMIKGLVDIVSDAWRWFKKWEPVIVAVTAGLVGFKLGLAAFAAAEFVGGLIALSKTVGVLRTAFVSLDIAMAANPAGLIALGFGLIAAAMALLIYYSDPVSKVFTTIGAAIVDFMLMPIYGVIKAIKWLAGTKIGEKMGLDQKSWEQADKTLTAFMEATTLGGWDHTDKRGRMPSDRNGATRGPAPISPGVPPGMQTVPDVFRPGNFTPAAGQINPLAPPAEVLNNVTQTTLVLPPETPGMRSKIDALIAQSESVNRQMSGVIQILSGQSLPGPASPVAPNEAAVAAQGEQSTFQGVLQIAGAPPGSKIVKNETRGAPALRVELAGSGA